MSFAWFFDVPNYWPFSHINPSSNVEVYSWIIEVNGGFSMSSGYLSDFGATTKIQWSAIIFSTWFSTSVPRDRCFSHGFPTGLSHFGPKRPDPSGSSLFKTPSPLASNCFINSSLLSMPSTWLSKKTWVNLILKWEWYAYSCLVKGTILAVKVDWPHCHESMRLGFQKTHFVYWTWGHLLL